MPRQAPGKKPANPHNNRHENGLVGPGKRIVKQKSNGHLNGSPKGGSQSSTPPLPTSTEPALTLGDENNLNGSLKDLKHDVDGDSDGFRSSQCPPSDDTPECYQNGTIHQTSSEVHSPRQPDVNASARDTIYSVNPVRLVSSIAKSCPIQDTIALLIFLLQLPPALLTTTQYLFATLSFMPSSVGAIIQLVDPLSKGSLGAPAITTVLVVSVLTILCMMPLWTPLQNFALDVAQVQIAITLGGGYSNKSGYFDSAFICILVVTAMHLSQSRDVRQFLAENVLSSWVFDFVRPHLPQMFQSLRPFSLIATQHFQHVPPGWVRLIPAGHILSQAALRIVRRWLFKQSMTQLTKTGKPGDTEASAGSNSQDVASESGSMAVPAAHMSDTPASPNKIQEKTERISSTKKRKRQQTLVRSQQPFWAALASIKVTIMREYEHSRTSAPGIGTSRSLLDTETPDILKVMGEEARVWILSVLPTVIKFDVSCSTFEEQEHESKAMRPTPPFYLRVNGAPWTSASIYPTHLGSKPEDDAMQHWVGEVSGLAPNCVYQCSMHRCDNDIEFCVLNLKTPAAPDTEQC
jgi:ubiquitination network signaling protein AcrB